VHNLDPVAVIKNRLSPLGATDNVLVKFNRNPLRRKRKLGDEIAQRNLIVNFPRFAVD
jgi:hypothetical protein